MMIYQIISYIKFLFKSVSSHGVHSPFVFDLLTHCLNIKKLSRNGNFKNFIALKKTLLKDNSNIEITDYGAGSKHFKNNTRIISDIAKHVGISNKKAKILCNILNYFKPNNILEIGTSIGLSTSILANHRKSNITTLEGCKNTQQIAKKYLSDFKNIDFILGEFSETLPILTQKNTYDLIYFDGNHTKEATIKYFNLCLKTTHNNSLFIFDDIYLNKKMQEAWQEIIKHPKVSVSIDIYHYGLLFFRKEQAKQHFYLRTNS